MIGGKVGAEVSGLGVDGIAVLTLTGFGATVVTGDEGLLPASGTGGDENLLEAGPSV